MSNISKEERNKMNSWLLCNLDSIVPNIAEASIIQFSHTVLLDNKLITSSAKTGLNFFRITGFNTNFKRLIGLVIKRLVKDLPHLESPEVVIGFFNDQGVHSDQKIVINVMDSEAVERYVRRMNFLISQKGLPIEITGPVNQTLLTSKYILEIKGDTRTLAETGDMYKAMFFLPQIMRGLKTIQRKAVYARESVRDAG